MVLDQRFLESQVAMSTLRVELNAAVTNCLEKGSNLHLFGIVSDAGVHGKLRLARPSRGPGLAVPDSGGGCRRPRRAPRSAASSASPANAAAVVPIVLAFLVGGHMAVSASIVSGLTPELSRAEGVGLNDWLGGAPQRNAADDD